jgi:RNA ligase
MINRLQELIEGGYIKKRLHPNGKLEIYNYTAKTHYENLWEKDTIECRGLIKDLDGNVIARPFKKFFNFDPLKHDISNEKYDVYAKFDGSLGILYFYEDVPYIATRGSFDSPQALHATKLLHTKYAHAIPVLDRSLTYLFEIIYPENRIVIDYNTTDILILIGVIETKTGKDIRLDYGISNRYGGSYAGLPTVTRHEEKNITVLCNLNNKNEEGYVIRLKDGTRYKIKFKDYVTLHGLKESLSNIKIWEMLKGGSDIAHIYSLSYEISIWTNQIVNTLFFEFEKIKKELEICFKSILDSHGISRKEMALEICKSPYKSALFAMLDNKFTDKFIWDIIKPVVKVQYSIIENE